MTPGNHMTKSGPATRVSFVNFMWKCYQVKVLIVLSRCCHATPPHDTVHVAAACHTTPRNAPTHARHATPYRETHVPKVRNRNGLESLSSALSCVCYFLFPKTIIDMYLIILRLLFHSTTQENYIHSFF